MRDGVHARRRSCATAFMRDGVHARRRSIVDLHALPGLAERTGTLTTPHASPRSGSTGTSRTGWCTCERPSPITTEAGGIHDRVDVARRPEVFFKATAQRVVGPGQPVGIRADSPWNVPEPELGIVLNAAGEIFGYVVGDDVSSRSIEGENPLYLTQAKVYDRSCALGPGIVPAWAVSGPFDIALRVQRGDTVAFEGSTSTARITRRFQDVAAWLMAALAFFPGRRGPAHRHRHRAGRVVQSPGGGRGYHRHSRHRHADQSGRTRRPGS
jgi:hypothetical protein